MRPWRALLLLVVVGCGSDDDQPRFDAPVAPVDGATPTADAPPAPIVDAGSPDVPSSLGKLCVTMAIDGGPGSCTGDAICCSAGGTTVCRVPSDCPTGPGYKSCTASSECQGSICCQLSTMTFCTKNNVCGAYGGTVLP